MTLARLAAFGADLDEPSNVTCVGGREGRISRGRGPVAVVVPTNEEGLIAADAARLAGIGGAEGVVIEEVVDDPVRLAV